MIKSWATRSKEEKEFSARLRGHSWLKASAGDIFTFLMSISVLNFMQSQFLKRQKWLHEAASKRKRFELRFARNSMRIFSAYSRTASQHAET